jgi:galactokinase
MTTQELKTSFEELYQASAEAIYFSPGRVNLIGEHTDYNGGYVFPCALSFGTYLLLRKNGQNVVNFRSLNQPEVTSLSFDKLTTRLENSWVNYPLGVIAQFIKRGIKFDTGLDILIWGNVPNGAGLSSSAALEVVTAYALNDLLGTGYDRTELAKIGQKAEHEFALVNCGIMDQFASANGKKDHAIFLDCNTLEFELVPVKLEGIKVLISNTHSPHKLDSGAYNQRVAECKKAVELISKVRPVNYLAELTEADFKAVEPALESDPVAHKRARHVVTEVQRTTDAVKALKAGEIEKFGKMMNASHVSLRDDYEVTGLELDTMAEAAWQIPGVIGSRMTGGGFGGCTVSLVKEEAIDTFIEKVGAAYKAKTGITPDFYVAEIGDGASKLL